MTVQSVPRGGYKGGRRSWEHARLSFDGDQDGTVLRVDLPLASSKESAPAESAPRP